VVSYFFLSQTAEDSLLLICASHSEKYVRGTTNVHGKSKHFVFCTGTNSRLRNCIFCTLKSAGECYVYFIISSPSSRGNMNEIRNT
jgi:hypothetical protein